MIFNSSWAHFGTSQDSFVQKVIMFQRIKMIMSVIMSRSAAVVNCKK